MIRANMPVSIVSSAVDTRVWGRPVTSVRYARCSSPGCTGAVVTGNSQGPLARVVSGTR
jgi:hypothetical protein